MDTDQGVQEDSLSKVDLGRLDAEQDDRLLGYFLDVGSVDQVANGAYFVLGRKGSGKTAIFRHLGATRRNHVVEMDLDKYVFQAHRKLVDAGVPGDFAYTESWRAAIAVAMFVEVMPDLKWLTRRRGLGILRKIGTGPNSGAFAAIVNWFLRVREVKLPSLAGVFDLGKISLDGPAEAHIESSTSRYVDQILVLIEGKIRDGSVTVLIDRLDDAWDGSDQSLRVIVGAVRAARDFKTKYRADKETPPSGGVPSL